MEMGPVYNVHEHWCSISKFYQWVSEQKDFHCGAAECKPTQWNAWRLVRGFQKTTCDWTTQLVRLHEALSNAHMMPNPMISSLLARLYEHLHQNHNAWVSRKPSLSWNPMPAPWESQCWTDWQKSHDSYADRGGTVHDNVPMGDRRMLHFLLDTLTSALTCLLELGLRTEHWSWARITEGLRCSVIRRHLSWLYSSGVWSSNTVDQIMLPIFHCTPRWNQQQKCLNLTLTATEMADMLLLY